MTSRPHRILFVGNYYRAWTTETHLARTLETLGHAVWRAQENETSPAQILDLARTHNVDIVWYQRTWGYSEFPPGAPPGIARDLTADLFTVWDALRAEGRVSVSYHLDLYVGLAREALLTDPATGAVIDPFWATDYVFTADGDPRTQRWMDAHGIRHFWSPPAVVADECTPGTADRVRWPADVAFVGSGPGYHPEHPERQDLLAWAQNRYGDRFRRYGLPEYIVRDAELNDLYASVPVIIGDSLARVWPDGTRHSYYWSDRIHETLGRGGVLVHPDVPGLTDTTGYEHGEHCLLYEFGDYDAVGEHVDWCLTHPNEARAMAERGRALTLARHTYAHRLAVVLALIDRTRS